MTAADACRSPAELSRLLSEPLTSADADALARHLEKCDRCAAAVDQALDRDSLSALLRSHTSMSTPAPPVQALIERLRQLRNADSNRTADL